MTVEATRVLLCDDHTVVREGLARLLDGSRGIAIVGSAADGAEGVAQTERLAPDVCLMDLSMPGMDGIEATRRIVASGARTAVLVLTSSGEEGQVRDALDAGACGYILKDAEPDELVRAVLSAARGDLPLDPRVARTLVESRRVEHPAAGLRPREREVLQLVGAGLSNKVIAIRLGISEATVKAHLTRIYQELGVADRTQAALWVARHGVGGG